jgi:hypothetical protein
MFWMFFELSIAKRKFMENFLKWEQKDGMFFTYITLLFSIPVKKD